MRMTTSTTCSQTTAQPSAIFRALGVSCTFKLFGIDNRLFSKDYI